MTLKFGTKRKDANRNREFIRNFPVGTTRIRLLVEPPEFLEYREHFDNDEKMSYPCLGTEQCIGCRSMTEDVAKTSWKFVFNALDSKNEVRLYKIGPRVMKDLEARWRMYNESLTNHDILIMRDGTGKKNTTYAVEVLSETILDTKEDYALKDPEENLTSQYQWAMRKYDDQRQDLGTVKLEPFEEALIDMVEEQNEPPFDPLEANLKELRQYCEKNNIPLTGTATRNTIVAAVQSHMK